MEWEPAAVSFPPPRRPTAETFNGCRAASTTPPAATAGVSGRPGRARSQGMRGTARCPAGRRRIETRGVARISKASARTGNAFRARRSGIRTAAATTSARMSTTFAGISTERFAAPEGNRDRVALDIDPPPSALSSTRAAGRPHPASGRRQDRQDTPDPCNRRKQEWIVLASALPGQTGTVTGMRRGEGDATPPAPTRSRPLPLSTAPPPAPPTWSLPVTMSLPRGADR